MEMGREPAMIEAAPTTIIRDSRPPAKVGEAAGTGDSPTMAMGRDTAASEVLPPPSKHKSDDREHSPPRASRSTGGPSP